MRMIDQEKVQRTRKCRPALLEWTVTAFVPAMYVYAGFFDPLNVKTIQELVYNILNTIVVIMFPIMVMMIVYTGFLFVTAQGNPAKITSARTALMWTVIGALVVLGAKALALAIKATVESL